MEDVRLSHSAFAQRLQRCADKAGSLYQLSKKAGLHRNTLGKYLRGTEPPRNNLLKIAQAADVSIAWLITGEEGQHAAGAIPARPELEHGLTMKPFLARLQKVCDSVGGVAELADATGLSVTRIQQLLAGEEMSVSEMARICSQTNTPASWLLRSRGFDQSDRMYVADALDELLARVEVVEENRAVGVTPPSSAKPGAWLEGNLSAIFDLWAKIFAKLPPKNYQILEIEDNLMAPELEPNDIAVVALEPGSTKPGIYLFSRDGDRFLARGVPAAGAISFSFDNDSYNRASANRTLLVDQETECLGRVVAVFGPPR